MSSLFKSVCNFLFICRKNPNSSSDMGNYFISSNSKHICNCTTIPVHSSLEHGSDNLHKDPKHSEIAQQLIFEQTLETMSVFQCYLIHQI